MPQLNTRVLITVTTSLLAEELHAYDQGIAGTYLVHVNDVAPEKPDQDDNPVIEAALDVFHDKIGIKVLDDFQIIPAVMAPDAPLPDDVHEL